MADLYEGTGAVRPGRSTFDMSYEKKFTCDMGQLIPVYIEEAIPGDFFQLGNEIVVRMQPLVAPVLHEINCFVHYFFIPNRLTWPKDETPEAEDGWEMFIYGGPDGDLTPTIPTWQVTGADDDNAEGSLWDYMEMPVDVVPAGAYPVDFPKRSYNLVYNEYYRDANLTDKIDIETSEDVLVRAWEKDYFTIALPWQQRGTAPSLPVTGTTSAVWTVGGAQSQNLFPYDASNNPLAAAAAVLNNNTVDLSSATTFTIAHLRLQAQIQAYLERNARAGTRYVEELRAHFGVSPKDARLQRPEYIGGSRSPMIVSEVLQTSSTDVTSPQGNLAGHGITADRNMTGSYKVQEHGIILGIMSIMPKPLYQQGIDRRWQKDTKYDYYSPEFANLSEQAILTSEIFATGVEAENDVVFGYQGCWDEYRTRRDVVVGQMRDTFDYWHISRQFAAAPTLNTSFIECDPRKDIFAAPDEPGFMVSIGNKAHVSRLMPYASIPAFGRN